MTWIRVVFASECDEDGDCPVCWIDYAECPCPGPMQEDEYDYTINEDGILLARAKGETE